MILVILVSIVVVSMTPSSALPSVSIRAVQFSQRLPRSSSDFLPAKMEQSGADPNTDPKECAKL